MKKISRRNFLKTCAIAGSAAALTACGGSSSTTSGSAGNTSGSASSGPQTITFYPRDETYPAVWLAASRASISLPVASIWTSGLTRMKRPTPSLPAATCRM